MGKNWWLLEYEQACDDFADNEDEEMFTARLKALGFDLFEIMYEIAAAKGEL